MIEEINGEDLLMMVLPELETTDKYDIPYSKVNSWRRLLQDNDIPYDLGSNDLETLLFEYPDNITIEHTEIIVRKTPNFIKRMELRIAYYDNQDLIMLNNLWRQLQ